MHAFGLLSAHMAHGYQEQAEQLLQQFILPELTSENPLLKARACWVYGQFGNFPIQQEHLKFVLNHMYTNIQDSDLPVKVNAAVSLIELLFHEFAVELLRSGLGSIIKIYLKLIDEIDYDQLIVSLKTIVEIYEEDIAPYAIELCHKLGESYVRLMETQKQTLGNGQELDIDSETSLTSEGLMTAIRRILQSISGKMTTHYPQLEESLFQSLHEALVDPNQASIEEGLSCIAELLFNQSHISERMWYFFQLIVTSIMTDQGQFDDYFSAVFVVLINFLNKGSEQMKTLQFPNQQGVSYLQVLCNLVQKTFELAKLLECEYQAMMAVTLVNGVLENVKDVGPIVLPGFLDLFLNEVQDIETPEFKNVLMQGFMMCFWYDFNTTQQYLESRGATVAIIQYTLEQATKLTDLEEIKRYMLGLTSMLTAPVCETISTNYSNIIKALSYLTQMSVQIREKNKLTKQRQEMAEVEDE